MRRDEERAARHVFDDAAGHRLDRQRRNSAKRANSGRAKAVRSSGLTASSETTGFCALTMASV
jgi:hypothetical protein